jgi:hypothetical protein
MWFVMGRVLFVGHGSAVVGFAECTAWAPPYCGNHLLSVVSNTQRDSGAAADGSPSHPHL